MKLRQKGFNGENWIQDMATDNDIRCKALGRVLPCRLKQCDIRQALLAGIITQVAQHRSVRFNGSNVARCWRECQGKPPRTSSDIQDTRLRGYYALKSVK